MKHEQKSVILKTLDHPTRFLFWDVDDFCLMFGLMFLGMGLGSLTVMCSGFLLELIYKKIKKRFRHCSFMPFLYWNIPTQFFRKKGKLKSLPASHIREFLL